MASRCTHPRLPHRFSPGSKLFSGTVVGWLTCWVRSYDSCDMEHAAPGSVFRASRSSNASSGLPGPPAGGRGKDGRIHNDSSRYSTEAQREVASLCLYICCHHFLYISILCWRDNEQPRARTRPVVVTQLDIAKSHSWLTSSRTKVTITIAAPKAAAQCVPQPQKNAKEKSDSRSS